MVRGKMELFYASGLTGPECRTDNAGGLLDRGWYWQPAGMANGKRYGPFTTAHKALAHALQITGRK